MHAGSGFCSAARACRMVAALATLLWTRPANAGAALTAADVERIIAQAVAEAERVRLRVTVAVVDHEGNVLGLF